MDVHGRPIILPANYSQYSPGPGANCPGGDCYGDPMAVDCGGCAEEQCGPHFFDVSAQVVFLKGEDLFEGIQPFSSDGIGFTQPKFLSPAGASGDHEPGWEIAVRYDLGALSFFEATYMGLYDMGFNEQVTSLGVTDPPLNFRLESVFSAYGTNLAVFPIAGVDDGSVHALSYNADLQSTELSFRRYWVGNNTRVSGTLLMGFRYLRFTEDFAFNTEALVVSAVDTASRRWESENDLLGFQVGGDGWICLRQGLRLGTEAKAGIYNNRFKFGNSADVPDPSDDFASVTKGNQIAFAAQSSIDLVADILPSFSIRCGYQALYMSSLAMVGDNIDTSDYFSNTAFSQGHALYHGFQGGLEYIW